MRSPQPGQKTKGVMISVIICTYNRDKYIFNVLESLAKNDFPRDRYEIVLVDNNCTDNTSSEVERFRNAYPDVSLRYFVETQQGLSYARNRGISEASGDVLVFLDDDAFTETDYLSTLSRLLVAHPEIDCFGGKITPLFEDGKEPGWLCSWTMSWVSALDMGEILVPFRKGYPIGANMGFRKSVIEACGIFNTSLGRSHKNLMGGEEKDIFIRVRNAGFSIYYLPGIGVHHVIPAYRTTDDYVKRLGQGVGASEKLRCKAEGGFSYFKRIVSEGVKWGGTIVLWLKYFITLKPECGNKLVRFRWNVTKKLIGHEAGA